MGSNYNNKVHFNDSTSLDVDSGGQVVIAQGGNIQVPVLGSTVSASTEVASGTTLPNFGVVYLNQVAPTTSLFTRTFTMKAPVKGSRVDIIVCSTASTEATIDINTGSGVGVKANVSTTSMQWIIATTDGDPASFRSLSLVGLSTALWGVLNYYPSSSAWLFAATSS